MNMPNTSSESSERSDENMNVVIAYLRMDVQYNPPSTEESRLEEALPMQLDREDEKPQGTKFTMPLLFPPELTPEDAETLTKCDPLICEMREALSQLRNGTTKTNNDINHLMSTFRAIRNKSIRKHSAAYVCLEVMKNANEKVGAVGELVQKMNKLTETIATQCKQRSQYREYSRQVEQSHHMHNATTSAVNMLIDRCMSTVGDINKTNNEHLRRNIKRINKGYHIKYDPSFDSKLTNIAHARKILADTILVARQLSERGDLQAWLCSRRADVLLQAQAFKHTKDSQPTHQQ